MNLTEMKAKPINELVEIAESHGLEDVGRLKKQEIMHMKYHIVVQRRQYSHRI